MNKDQLENEMKEARQKVRDFIQSSLLSQSDIKNLVTLLRNLENSAKFLINGDFNELGYWQNIFNEKKKRLENCIEKLRNSTPGGKNNSNYAEYSRFVHLHGHEYHQSLESMYVSNMPEQHLINRDQQLDWQI